MQNTITNIKRYIRNTEVTREELLSREISNPVLENLWKTALCRKTSLTEEKRQNYKYRESV